MHGEALDHQGQRDEFKSYPSDVDAVAERRAQGLGQRRGDAGEQFVALREERHSRGDGEDHHTDRADAEGCAHRWGGTASGYGVTGWTRLTGMFHIPQTEGI